MKFNIGDILIGNELNNYGVTSQCNKCKVINISDLKDEIEVKLVDRTSKYYEETFWVNPTFFKLASKFRKNNLELK